MQGTTATPPCITVPIGSLHLTASYRKQQNFIEKARWKVSFTAAALTLPPTQRFKNCEKNCHQIIFTYYNWNICRHSSK